jgi:hypothetical protein
LSLCSSPNDDDCRLAPNSSAWAWTSQSHKQTGVMKAPKPLPPILLGQPFTVASARREGVTARRLRNADLATGFRGIRSDISITSTEQAARTYAVTMPPDAFFSHLTAAEILGLRLPESYRTNLLHVTSIAPRRAPRARRVCGHQAADGRTSVVRGLRLSDPLSTWCALAAVLPVDDLIVMGDGLVRRRHPWVTIEQLRDAVDHHAGRRGFARLVAARTLIRPLTDSARETMLRLILVRSGLPEPDVNGVILNSHGAEIAHGDLVFRNYRTLVEYDGGHHRTDEAQFNIDIERLDEIMEEGWRVIRVNKSLMARRATLLGKVETALKVGGWRPTAT